MGLKPDRREFNHDITWKFAAIAERGGIPSVVTTGSGGYPGTPLNVAAYATNPSGVTPLGMLLDDVVSYDTNRQHENFYKSGFQSRIGMPVCIDRGGHYNTNMIPSGVTVVAPQPAYLAANGLISNVQATGAPRVGTWVSNQDQDGFAKIQINLP
jgi:hypothetical protein